MLDSYNWLNSATFFYWRACSKLGKWAVILGESIVRLSPIFLLDFWTISTIWYFCFYFNVLVNYFNIGIASRKAQEYLYTLHTVSVDTEAKDIKYTCKLAATLEKNQNNYLCYSQIQLVWISTLHFRIYRDFLSLPLCFFVFFPSL